MVGDVRSIRTLLTNEQCPTVYVDLKSGITVDIKFYSEQDALIAAGRLADAINETEMSE